MSAEYSWHSDELGAYFSFNLNGLLKVQSLYEELDDDGVMIPVFTYFRYGDTTVFRYKGKYYLNGVEINSECLD